MMFKTIAENLRQNWYYSKEFRISSPSKANRAETVDNITTLLNALVSSKGESSEKDDRLIKQIAAITTAVWRLRKRLNTQGPPTDEARKALLDLESIWDTLAAGGFEVKDHVGEKFDSGMALHVVAFQPMPGTNTERVIETIKPTIYRKDKLVQMGEVIVSEPEISTLASKQTQV